MTATLASTKTAVATALAPGGVPPTGIEAVFPYETRTGQGSCFATVSTGGVDPETWRIRVRIYVSVTLGEQAASDLLDVVIMSADAALGLIDLGPSEWSVDFDDLLNAFVAETNLQIGREDYF